MGLQDRHQLTRLLRREGLPPFQELRWWMSAISWLWTWEHEGTALCVLALHLRMDPAACYRTVQRVAGMTWSEVQQYGSGYLLQRFRRRCEYLLTQAPSGRAAEARIAA